MLSESQWTREICKQLEQVLPIIITPLSASRLSMHGIPDRHFNSELWSGFVEFKGEKTKLTRLQSSFLRRQNMVTSGSAFIWRKQSNFLHNVILQDWEEKELLIDSAFNCLKEMHRIKTNG